MRGLFEQVSGDTTRPEDGLAPPEDDVPVVFDDEAIEVPPALDTCSTVLEEDKPLANTAFASSMEVNARLVSPRKNGTRFRRECRRAA